jgi:hypothetical protein
MKATLEVEEVLGKNGLGFGCRKEMLQNPCTLKGSNLDHLGRTENCL